MSSATVGALRVSLGLDSAQFTEGLKAAQKHLKGVGKQMQQTGATIATVGAGMTAAITAPLIAMGFAASKAATQAAEAMGQVEAALVSMGGASGKTKEELAKLADGLMRSSLYDDDDILRKVTANLLTFGNVAGAEFNRAQQAAVDLATRMNMDLQPATLLIGKALNDPIKGLTAMGRAGIQFSDSQKETIKSMVAAGNAAGAQRIILAELERQFGGAAAAAQSTDPYDRMRDSLNTLSESMGGIINEFLVPMLDKLAALFDRFNTLSPQMQKFIVIGAALAAALGPVVMVIGGVVSAVGVLIASPLLPFIAAAAAAAAVLAVVFAKWGKDIIPVLQHFGKEVAAVLGPKLKPLFDAVVGLVGQLGKAFAAIFSSEGGSASQNFKAFGTLVARVFGAIVDIMTGAINVITNLMRAVGAALRGDWSLMWNALGSAVRSMVVGVLNAIETLFPGITESVRKTYEGVKLWLQGKLFDVLRGVVDKVKWVSDAFFKLYDAVVGHSFVPDMVEGIADWMAKLDAGMVVPARNATDKTRETFETLRNDVASITEGLMTDQERAARELARQTATIRRAVATPGMGVSAAQGAQLEGGVAAAGMTLGDRIGPLGAMASLAHADGLRGGLRASRQAFDEAANSFADSFANGMERVLNGDIKGFFNDLLRDLMSELLRGIGRSIFSSMNGNSSGGNIWATLGRAVVNTFSGGGARAPGFKTGGSFKVGGSGGADSQLMQFRATPGEMVNIRKPGQDLGGTVVRVIPSPYFDVQVERVAAPMAVQAATTAYSATRSDMATAQRRNRQRFV